MPPDDRTYPPFVARASDQQPDWLCDRQRYILWHATGIVIDDTDFGTGTEPTLDRWWFPPCTRQLSPQWWATMQKAAKRIEQALRTGEDLCSYNFAEQVVLGSVLRSEAMTQIIEYVDDEPDEYDALEGTDEPDLDFASVPTELFDEAVVGQLFPDDFRPPRALAPGEPVPPRVDSWFARQASVPPHRR